VDLVETSGMNFREIYDYLEAEYGTAISREEFVRRFNEAAEEIYTERAPKRSTDCTTSSPNWTTAASPRRSFRRRHTTGSAWSSRSSISRARSTA